PAGPQAAPFALGPWRIEPETGRIVDGDTTTSLEPRVMALLVLLASAPGRVFSRETIEADLWPGSVVGEDTVARTVSRLRKALGDSAQTPRFVETLPRRVSSPTMDPGQRSASMVSREKTRPGALARSTSRAITRGSSDVVVSPSTMRPVSGSIRQGPSANGAA
ncbi:MAG: winged helix-turn-helix domain-containing protein, partial [Pseudomonadota bacterium]